MMKNELKALSIRQPWASLIIWGLKDIENRAWSTDHRGKFLVHAGWNLNKDFAADPRTFFEQLSERVGRDLTKYTDFDFPRGGIIGQATLVDCVTNSNSPWYAGNYGFVLADPCECNFQPSRGGPGFFFMNSAIST